MALQAKKSAPRRAFKTPRRENRLRIREDANSGVVGGDLHAGRSRCLAARAGGRTAYGSAEHCNPRFEREPRDDS